MVLTKFLASITAKYMTFPQEGTLENARFPQVDPCYGQSNLCFSALMSILGGDLALPELSQAGSAAELTQFCTGGTLGKNRNSSCRRGYGHHLSNSLVLCMYFKIIRMGTMLMQRPLQW